mgnify:CR=1 FL=1
MKLRNTLIVLFSILTIPGFSQVPQKIIIEHFTNTRCSICGARNPGLYTNIDSQNEPNIIHLAVHPSSPYSSCVFSQHNKRGNDARTGYYGLLGATPQIVINGESVNGSFTSPTLFDSYKNQMSSVSISLTQQKMTDSMRVKIVVITEANHSMATQKLYVVLAEDTVFYNAPNGENQHYDVFRTTLLGNTGTLITVPSTVGDSVVFVQTVANHSDWDMSRMFAVAILQNESDKIVNQVEALNASANDPIVTGIRTDFVESEVAVYPNPVQTEIQIVADTEGEVSYRILSLTGKEMISGTFIKKTSVNVQNIPVGVYFVTIISGTKSYTQKMVKVNP